MVLHYTVNIYFILFTEKDEREDKKVVLIDK